MAGWTIRQAARFGRLGLRGWKSSAGREGGRKLVGGFSEGWVRGWRVVVDAGSFASWVFERFGGRLARQLDGGAVGSAVRGR